MVASSLLFASSAALIVAIATVRVSLAYDYDRGVVSASDGRRHPCPGRFCGRTQINETHLGPCGKCEKGYRVTNNSHSICGKCTDTPTHYDMLYFLFMASFPLILNWVATDYTAPRRSFLRQVLPLHVCALFEIAIAALITLVICEPTGQLTLISCRVNKLADWYSVLHNPQPNYEKTLYCGQEAVYPLYTMVFIFYAVAILLMILLRPLLASKLLPRRGRNAIYTALYFYPVLAVCHAIFGGLLYFCFPYIVIILSLASSAAHFAFKLDQSAKALLLDSVTDSRNMSIVIGHWLLHAFGIIAITTSMQDSESSASGEHLVRDMALLGLVPLPAAFYIATSTFSDPNNLHNDMNS